METYIEQAIKTDSKDYTPADRRIRGQARLLHAVMGLSTEANELLDALKKEFFYGKKVDKTNMKEELGDILWYIAIACDYYDFTIEQVMETNIRKLRARYGDCFSEENAKHRDIEREYNVLSK